MKFRQNSMSFMRVIEHEEAIKSATSLKEKKVR